MQICRQKTQPKRCARRRHGLHWRKARSRCAGWRYKKSRERKMRGFRVAACGLGAAFAIATAGPISAQDYPTRPVTVIGTTPGGASVDLVARYFGERVKDKTGQPWVLENKPGAAGSIAAKAAASAKP